MSREKTTPGPWQVLNYGSQGAVIAAGDVTVARLDGHDCDDHEACAAMTADARLIAAAPEMYAHLARMATALSTAASYLARDTDRGIADAFEAEANAARALLATIDGTEG